MKNKGFTIVELLSTFILSSIIIVIMFQMIINLKEIYQQSGIKTEILNKQYIIENKIYTDLNEKKALQISNCGVTTICIEFTFQDGSTTQLEVDETNKKISYDGYVINLNSDTDLGIIDINTSSSISEKKIFSINIPIYNKNYKNTNFGINIVYPYNEIELNNNYSSH